MRNSPPKIKTSRSNAWILLGWAAAILVTTSPVQAAPPPPPCIPASGCVSPATKPGSDVSVFPEEAQEQLSQLLQSQQKISQQLQSQLLQSQQLMSQLLKSQHEMSQLLMSEQQKLKKVKNKKPLPATDGQTSPQK